MYQKLLWLYNFDFFLLKSWLFFLSKTVYEALPEWYFGCYFSLLFFKIFSLITPFNCCDICLNFLFRCRISSIFKYCWKATFRKIKNYHNRIRTSFSCIDLLTYIVIIVIKIIVQKYRFIKEIRKELIVVLKVSFLGINGTIR